jgi:DNA-binding transcriptional MerR regulator
MEVSRHVVRLRRSKLPTRLVCERYSITDRTVDRWLENGILPPPVRINGLRYWYQRELEQRESEFKRD